jgi:hypothetical protein
VPDTEDEGTVMYVGSYVPKNVASHHISYVPKNVASHHIRLESSSCGLHNLIVVIAGLTMKFILPVT